MNFLTPPINHTRTQLTRENTDQATPGAPRTTTTTAVDDTHEARPNTASSTTVSDSSFRLQAPTGAQCTARRVQSNADSTLQVPAYARPVLTRASLEAWQNADGLADNEIQDRNRLAKTILRTAAPSATAGSPSDSLQIIGDLYLFRYPNLTQLPKGLHVSRDLDCRSHSNLTQLPEGLSVGGNLNCRRCPGLTQLPEELSVGGDLDCSHCPNLRQLPEGLSISGDLDCSGCPNLTQLPEGLSISGDLDCSGCPNLTQLPEGLSVGGRLKCRHCTGLTHLPEGLSVGGNLNCTGCTSLTSLPNSIASWGHQTNGDTREIDLSGSGIAPALLQRLEQAEVPGIRFYFSMAPSAPADVRFADLNTAASFWSEQAQRRTTPDLAAWTDVSVRDCDFLRQFLGRLCDTADYQHPNARVRLAGRVCDLLQAMNESSALRRLGSDCISDALQTCNDRVIWAMNQVEIAVRIHQAQHTEEDGAKLKELVLSFMRLDIVQDHARQKVNTLDWVDEIEVFLAYESGLREDLKLPVSAEHMLFARCAQVTKADLAMARDAADAAVKNPDQVATYLENSAPWQHHLRRQEAKQWSWERVALEPWPQGLKADELQCAITLEDFAELTQPVLAPSGSTWRAYEAEALLTHWIEHGTDAFNQKLKLAELRRLA